MINNNSEKLDGLQKVVERACAAKAMHIGESAIIEKFGDRLVWKGIVHVFKIEGNPKAEICYAWSSPIKGSTKRRYYAVLKIPPIDSPEKAVRAAIVNDYKTSKP